ncbi:MAG: tyrosine-type recombinase/integrase [Clostridia bacterium]|nr:tyrosine-type recombinase/integrase [Clostridia bacterium]
MGHIISKDEFSSLIQEFASYKRSIQGCSMKTVDEYLLDLRTFFRYLVAREKGIPYDSKEFTQIDIRSVGLKELEKIHTEDLYDYLAYITDDRENKWCARARKLSAIRALYKYLVNKRHYLEYNPTVDIDSPKAQKTLPKVLSLSEATRLLETVEADKDSKYRLRDYAILTLFLNCGMRLSELVGININDIDSEMTSLRVTGKGSKERVIYLNDACQYALTEYLIQRLSHKHTKTTEKALFLSRLEQRISVKTVQAMVYKYLRLAGLESKHYSVHKLRHTAATLMYQTGKVDVRVLKEILGHEQLNTTQIYTHVSNAEMERAMTQNPLAQRKRQK